jgi:isoleucyl-tRNA synthetase
MARRAVDPNQSFPALEQQVLERWRERDVFAESVRMREGADEFVFYEGPPTANGKPGSHHVLARVFKDIFPATRRCAASTWPARAAGTRTGCPSRSRSSGRWA